MWISKRWKKCFLIPRTTMLIFCNPHNPVGENLDERDDGADWRAVLEIPCGGYFG